MENSDNLNLRICWHGNDGLFLYLNTTQCVSYVVHTLSYTGHFIIRYKDWIIFDRKLRDQVFVYVQHELY
jgi:hypothetical protein